MQTANLRKVGGSVMLAVPPVFLEQLELHAGAAVELGVNNGQLWVKAAQKKKYTLAQLLQASDYERATELNDEQWLNSSPLGRELL